MADAVSIKVIESNPKYYEVEFNSVSDGTGEAAALKVDKSTLTDQTGKEPKSLTLEYVNFDIQGYTNIQLLWDRATDEVITLLSGANSGENDYGRAGRRESLQQSQESASTGDVLLTTVGHTAGDSYRIRCRFRLEPQA